MGIVSGIVERTDEVAVRAATAVDTFPAYPSAGQATAMAAEMEAVRIEALSIHDALSPLQEEALVSVLRGDVVVDLWRWRRTTARSLVYLAGRAALATADALSYATAPEFLLVTSKEGDTVQRLAAKYMGSWTAWPRILAANKGLSLGALPSGTSVMIPVGR